MKKKLEEKMREFLEDYANENECELIKDNDALTGYIGDAVALLRECYQWLEMKS